MKTYYLDWDKIKDKILSYKSCRKLYLDDINKINMLVKEDFSDDLYHIYKYNNDVEFIIRNMGVYNDKIEGMVVFLLSNNYNALKEVYEKFR